MIITKVYLTSYQFFFIYIGGKGKKGKLNSEKVEIPVIQKKNDTHENYCWLLKEVRNIIFFEKMKK